MRSTASDPLAVLFSSHARSDSFDTRTSRRGNHIILEIGPRLYATYAHLKPGSLRVAVGQRVTRGHVIGLVGNGRALKSIAG